MRYSRAGFTLLELMIVMAMIAVLVAIAIPGLLAAQRSSNERSGSAGLKVIATAEMDFRSNDRDNNRIRDFWTLDLFALYGLYPLVTGGGMPADGASLGGVVKLLEPSLASADALEQSTGAAYGNVNPADSILIFSPKAGYCYRMFTQLDEGAGGAPIQIDTDGPAPFGAVHDHTRFGVMAFPENLSTGKLLFIVSQEATIYKFLLPSTFSSGYVGGSTATSTVSATGQVMLNSATTYPASPSAIGFSKLD